MITADVVVVGGGIVGMCTALRLAEAGLDVHLMDQRAPGKESSWAGAGLLLPQTETDPPGSRSGLPGMVQADAMLSVCLKARDTFPAFLDWLQTRPGARAQDSPPPRSRLDGVLCLALGPQDLPHLQSRVVWQVEQGLEARMVDAAEAESLVGGLRCHGAAFFPRDGWYDNQALMPVLARAVASAVSLHVETQVTGVTTKTDRVTGVTTARADLPAIQAAHVVLAAGAWTSALIPEGEPRPRIAPSRGQMILMEAAADAPRRPAIGGESYVVPRPGGRVLLGATVQDAGFDTTVPPESLQEIRDGVAGFLPRSRDWKQLDAWSGLRPRAAGDLPVIGPGRHQGLWLASGHFRNGLLLGPLTGEWITEGVTTGSMPREAHPFAPRDHAAA